MLPEVVTAFMRVPSLGPGSGRSASASGDIAQRSPFFKSPDKLAQESVEGQ
jgi:hypothetical protein